MAESSGEKVSVINQGKFKKVMNIARNATMAIGLITAADRGVDVKNDPSQVFDAGASVVREVHDTALGTLKASAAAVDKISPQTEVNPNAKAEKVLSPEERKTIDEVIDIFYPGTNEAEREELGNQIKITAEYMKGLLTPESYKNCQENKKLIQDVAEYSGVPEDIFWGLLMAESRCGVDGGEPNASDALGPVQITGMKGKDYGLNITNDETDDRHKWDRALAVAAIDISQKTRYFSGEDPTYQNWGLGVWSWHKGQTGVKQEIESYSANKAQAFTDLQEYIKANNITVKTILDIPNIRERLEDPENNYDLTTVFVLRVAGGALLVKNMEKVAEHAEAEQ